MSQRQESLKTNLSNVSSEAQVVSSEAQVKNVSSVQNVSSEAKVKNFFILWKSYVPLSRYSRFAFFTLP